MAGDRLEEKYREQDAAAGNIQVNSLRLPPTALTD
jgi:hypothetical protein